MYISILIMIYPSKIYFSNNIFTFFFLDRNNHPSPSPPKLNLPIPQSSNVESDGEIEDDDDEHQLNIDDSKEQNTTIFDNDEQSSDEEQVRKNDLFERGRTFSKIVFDYFYSARKWEVETESILIGLEFRNFEVDVL